MKEVGVDCQATVNVKHEDSLSCEDAVLRRIGLTKVSVYLL